FSMYLHGLCVWEMLDAVTLWKLQILAIFLFNYQTSQYNSPPIPSKILISTVLLMFALSLQMFLNNHQIVLLSLEAQLMKLHMIFILIGGRAVQCFKGNCRIGVFKEMLALQFNRETF